MDEVPNFFDKSADPQYQRFKMTIYATIGAVVLAGVLWGVACGKAAASDFFTEDFSGDGLGPNLAVTFGAEFVDATGETVLFTGSTDATRGGIGTVDSDYAAVDFTATMDLLDNDDVFIGMGPGTSEQAGFFGEPATGPTIYMRVGNAFNGDVYLYLGTETQLVPASDAVIPPQPQATGDLISSVRMVNTAATDMLEFLYSIDGGETYTSAGFVDYSASTLGAGISRIYATGGNGPSEIDNFSVIGNGALLPRFVSITTGDDEENPGRRKVSLTWTANPGKFYSLFSSVDLESGHWEEVDDGTEGVDGLASYVHRNIDPSIPMLYYQARENP